MNSFNVEGVIMPVFARGSQENTESGKQYNFLMEEDYIQYYILRVTARIKNLEKRSSNR